MIIKIDTKELLNLKNLRYLSWTAILILIMALVPFLILKIKSVDNRIDENYIYLYPYFIWFTSIASILFITFYMLFKLNIWINKSDVAIYLKRLEDDDSGEYESKQFELIPDKTSNSLTKSRKKLANLLSDLIYFSDDNHVYGLNSPWGRGKTSIMKQTERNLHYLNSPRYPCKTGNEKKVVTAWLPAWTIDSKVHPAIALIETITDAMEKQIPINHPIHAVSRFLRDWSAEAGLQEISLAKTMTLNRKKINQSGHCNFQRIARELRTLAANCNQYKIVIFIDDIDRCEGSVALELLDSLKSIFYQNLFVFVAAYDRSLIEGTSIYS